MYARVHIEFVPHTHIEFIYSCLHTRVCLCECDCRVADTNSTNTKMPQFRRQGNLNEFVDDERRHR